MTHRVNRLLPVYHLHLSFTDHESSDLPPAVLQLPLERAKRYSEKDRPQTNNNGGNNIV